VDLNKLNNVNRIKVVNRTDFPKARLRSSNREIGFLMEKGARTKSDYPLKSNNWKIGLWGYEECYGN
jgi:hypothetical protein